MTIFSLMKSQQIRWLIRLYNFVETNLFISIDFAAKKLGIAYNTAAKNVKILQKLGILEKNNDQLRYLRYIVIVNYCVFLNFIIKMAINSSKIGMKDG